MKYSWRDVLQSLSLCAHDSKAKVLACVIEHEKILSMHPNIMIDVFYSHNCAFACNCMLYKCPAKRNYSNCQSNERKQFSKNIFLTFVRGQSNCKNVFHFFFFLLHYELSLMYNNIRVLCPSRKLQQKQHTKPNKTKSTHVAEMETETLKKLENR
jgi:hypothetical protein